MDWLWLFFTTEAKCAVNKELCWRILLYFVWGFGRSKSTETLCKGSLASSFISDSHLCTTIIYFVGVIDVICVDGCEGDYSFPATGTTEECPAPLLLLSISYYCWAPFWFRVFLALLPGLTLLVVGTLYSSHLNLAANGCAIIRADLDLARHLVSFVLIF
jgi:hypothetical protein